MSCELLIGISQSSPPAIKNTLTSNRFVNEGGRLNGPPYSTDELNRLIELDGIYDWYVAMRGASSDLDIAYSLSTALRSDLDDLFSFISTELDSFAVMFSDSGTNDLEVIGTLNKSEYKHELLQRYDSGAPDKSTVLLFGDLKKSEI